MPYSSYDHDKLEAAETMRIERRIYFEAKDREIAPYASLPIAQLLSMRSESAAAEQAIFDDLKERAAAWEEQAGRTLLLDKTLEYVRTPHVQHTANEWQTTEHNRHIRSNRVYQMNYYITRIPATTKKRRNLSRIHGRLHGACAPTAQAEPKRRLPDKIERFSPTRQLWKSI